MTGFVIRKLLRTLFTLFLVVTFVFFVLRLTGDPVSAMMPDDTDPAILDELRKQWGLDRPPRGPVPRILGQPVPGRFRKRLP